MRFNLLLSILVLVFICAFGIILQNEIRDEMDGQQKLLIQKFRDHADQKFEFIKRNATTQYQIRNILYGFQEKASQILEKSPDEQSAREIISTLYQKLVQPFLPSHDLVLMSFSGIRSRMLFHHGEGLGFTPELATMLGSYHWKIPIAADSLRPLVRDLLKFPVPAPVLLDFKRRNELQTFNSCEAVKGWYQGVSGTWPDTKPILCMAVLDFSAIPKDFSYNSLCQAWNDEDSGLALLAEDEVPLGKVAKPTWVLSSFFKHHAAGRQALKKISRRDLMRKTFIRRGNIVLFLEKNPSGSRFQAILAYRLPQPGKTWQFLQAFSMMLVLLTFGLTLLFAIDKTVFRRGPKLRVGAVLLGTFLLATALPVAGIYMFSRKALEDYARQAQSEVARSVHQKLARLDAGIQFHHAKLVQKALALGRSRQLARRFLHIETTRNLSLGRSTLERLAGYFHLDASLINSGNLFNNLLAVIGPGTFTRSWGTSDQGTPGSDQNLVTLMAPWCRRYLNKLNPGLTASMTAPVGGVEKNDLDAIKVEAIFDAIAAVSTPQNLINNLHHPEELQEVKMQAGRGYSLQVPLLLNGLARFIVFLFWDQTLLDEPYLRQVFTRAGTKDFPYPDTFCSPVIYAQESLPAGISSFPNIVSLIDRVRTTRSAVQISLPDENLVVEALPGHFTNQYIFGTQQDTSFIQANARKRWNVFRSGLVINLLLALLAAWFGAAYFIKPIRELLLAMASIDAGKFEVRVDSTREDEFGSLGSAFNRMAKGLEEGNALRMYVSSFIRRSLVDERFRREAQEGKTSNVTILFSSIHGFEEFQQHHTPEETFHVMETHLNAVNIAAGKFLGEIDKVMGDKILVIFDHEGLGGGRIAAQKALQTVLMVRKIMKRTSSPDVAMGLNSGSVISGFLGASAKRQDYTVIGDTVNLAARLASLAHDQSGTRVVLSDATRGLLDRSTKTLRLPIQTVKGKTRQVKAFLLIEEEALPSPKPVSA